ncbi:1,4-dihydroxy-2-naphthoate octaprenyltransferase [Oceaniferula spumae]|uniref:1,4-dihydroxy-2-naphthoate octaprenyltransferase n=1 Tax=Oceaniferula spumae TaxID=2979115 RepID=A0AAT9FQN6_9BACT
MPDFFLGEKLHCGFSVHRHCMKSYFLAARPKTLPAAIVPVWVGCALAYYLEGSWNLTLAVYTLMGAIWIQIATNFFNDAIDSDKGADTEARLGPVRATASGQLSRNTVFGAAVVCLLIAAVFGYLLFAARGWPILAIGIPSLYLCYGYTGGPVPLAYRGLGELFVILFFGVVAVTGTVFVQIGSWPPEAFIMGISIGCLSAILISINNLRDLDEDRGNHKNTLAVKWGRERALNLLILMEVPPYAVLVHIFGWQLNLLVFLPALLLGIFLVRKVIQTPPGTVYNKFLALSALQLILYAAAIHLMVVL